MFERFSKAARAAVVEAQQEAIRADSPTIGTECLLYALLDAPDAVSGDLLRRHGLDRDRLADDFAAVHRRGGLTQADAAALGELGIDVDAIVANVEQRRGEFALAGSRHRKRRRVLPDHRPITEGLKEVLEGSLTEARELGESRIGDEHMLLALLKHATQIADVLAIHGLTYTSARQALATRAP